MNAARFLEFERCLLRDAKGQPAAKYEHAMGIV
jgi:hypothetical protein